MDLKATGIVAGSPVLPIGLAAQGVNRLAHRLRVCDRAPCPGQHQPSRRGRLRHCQHLGCCRPQSGCRSQSTLRFSIAVSVALNGSWRIGSVAPSAGSSSFAVRAPLGSDCPHASRLAGLRVDRRCRTLRDGRARVSQDRLHDSNVNACGLDRHRSSTS